MRIVAAVNEGVEALPAQIVHPPSTAGTPFEDYVILHSLDGGALSLERQSAPPNVTVECATTGEAPMLEFKVTGRSPVVKPDNALRLWVRRIGGRIVEMVVPIDARSLEAVLAKGPTESE